MASIFTVKMPAIYTRRFALPARSFLLLGARGTGKTTYLGDRALQAGPVRVLPLNAFLHQLASGRVLTARKTRSLTAPN